MSPLSSRRLLIRLIVFVLCLLVIAAPFAPIQSSFASSPRLENILSRAWPTTPARFSTDPVAAAWERVQDAGSYHFSGDVVQLTVPAATVRNVGRPSRTEQLYLEGQSDLDASALEFRLWSDGSTMLNNERGLAVRAVDGKSYVRQGTGDWQEGSTFTNAIAPGGDFMGYLAAARDITPHPTETRAGITFTRYSFQIDGPAFATFVRDQTEAAMRARGELPNGVHLEVSSYYHHMTGDGEFWVRADGLPLRQILNLRFPEQGDESVQAQIKIDFSHFGQTRFVGGEFVQVDGTANAGRFASGWATLQQQAERFGILWTLFPVLALTLLVVVYRRKRTLQVALSLSVIVSMLIGPMLNTLHLTTFLDGQTARAAEQKVAQEESAMLRELRTLDATPQFDPHQNPLAAASTAPAPAPATVDNFAPRSAPSIQATDVLTEETDSDSDDDELTDFVEQRIGTSVALADSDGDQITDDVEVAGFTTSSGTWYPDPLDPDSNGDTIADTLEYDVDENGQPDDTDGDGTPDMFDDDNDGDGISDRMDLAPFAKSSATYGESNPLLLQVENLTVQSSGTAVSTFVDFQIRPTSAAQLRFAANRLDWPSDDEGQIRDVGNGTNNSEPDDLALLPMLEIRIPSGANMLPADSALEPYGITVGDDVSGGKVAYIPLNVVTDPQSGERVAFSGRMLYLPQGAWQQPHSVRMVWVVQVDNDTACDPNDAEDVQNGCTSDGYFLNQPQIVHRYYEDWILTGLNVIEDHGADVALIYEDPNAEPANDGPTWLLTSVLGERFITVVDNGGNAQRTLTMDNLDTQLDRTINSGDAEVAYGLPNIFNVVKNSYTNFDEAIYKAGTETATSVLDTHFTDPAQKPLLLFAYETNIRSIGLDAARINNSYASLNGTQLTMNFNPSGQPDSSIDTTAGFKWTPYCSNPGGTPVWETCDPVTYWQELEARHGEQYLDPETLALVPASAIDPDVAEGEMMAVQLYALSMLQGISSLVMRNVGGNTELVTGLYASESDTELTDSVRSGLGFTTAAAKWIANRELLKIETTLVSADGRFYSRSDVLKRLALRRIDNRGVFSTIKGLSRPWRYGARAAIGLVVLGTATAAALTLAGYDEAEVPTQIAVGAIQTAMSLGVPIRTAFIGAQETGKGLAILKGLSSEIGYTQKAGVLGASFAIGVTWGLFIATATTNQMAPFGAEFNSALAETIAATILIIFLTILSFTVIGLIIVGIIAFLDILFTLLCEYGGADSLRTEFTGGCFTISGAVTATIVKALYNYDIMIDMGRADLVTTGAPDIQLGNPDLGFVANNTISVTFPITTHAVHKDPDPSAGIYINLYLWLFSKANLRSSTFEYSLTHPNKEDITGLERDDMTNQWKNVKEDHKYVLTPMYGGEATTIPDAAVVSLPPQAGLNQSVEFYHNMGYAIPAYECFVVPVPVIVTPVTPVCYTRTFKGKNSTLIDSLLLDILPNTLDEFILTTQKEDGGFGLAWDEAFRSLPDEDGDGLRSSLYNGLDPDDRAWDADFDGLSDSFEREQQQAGVNMSPVQPDTDGDGLTDAQELQFGTNPGIADSDNDGLSDGEEVRHLNVDTGTWEGGIAVRINAATPFDVQVSSDPNARDSDGDGVSDAAEFQLASEHLLDDNNVPYHPNVSNKPPVRFYLTSDAVQNRFVEPGQQFVYTTTVVATTPLDPGVLDVAVLDSNGNSSNLLGVSAQRYGLPFDPDNFSTTPTVTHSTTFAVNGNAPTQTSVRVNNTVRAQLAGSDLGDWEWNPTAGGTWSFSGDQNQPVFTAASPTTLDRPDLYRVATKAMLTPNFDTFGDIKTQDVTSGIVRQLDNDTFERTIQWTPTETRTMVETSYLYGPTAPDIACNESGNCMVVWERVENCSSATINSIEVLKEGSDGGSGIEPVIYLVRDFNDTNPTNGGYELLWNAKPAANGGNDMQKNEKRGPNELGFPINFDFCDNDRIVVYESDNQDDLDNFNLTNWNQQGFAGSNFVQPGGFWNETGDTVGLLYNDAGCSGCEISLSITSNSKQIRTVAGALLDPNGAVIKPQFDLSSFSGNDYTVGFHRPIVATNGDDFLVAWERSILPVGAFRNAGNTTVKDAIVTRRFAGDGTPLTNNTLVTNSEAQATITVQNYQLNARPRARLVMDWAGDRYLLTRLLLPHQVTATGEWGQGITIRELNGNGQLISGSFSQLIGSARKGINDSYDWGYDSRNERALLVYWDQNSFLQGRLLQRNSPGNYTVIVPSNAFFTNVGDAGSPQVEFDPATTGWLVGWTGSARSRFEALDAESSTRLGEQTFLDSPTVNSNALACPAPQSLPVVDLRFEEVPGTTTFADQSGYGYSATCSGNGCPLPGAVGAPDAQLSAYALDFDGGDDSISLPKPSQLSDSFSIAFWYKANSAGSGPAFYITSNPPNTNNNPGFSLFIDNTSGMIKWWVGSKQGSANSSLNDGNWHFVTATYAGNTGTMNVYLDGSLTPAISDSTAQAPTLGSTINVGGGTARVTLDQLQFYGVALSNESAKNIKTPGATQPFCIATSANASNQAIQWNKLSIAREETFTPITASAASTITVDSDAPTASVTGAQYVKVDDGGSAILTIGGTAHDPSSGISSVAVSIDGSTFQPAEGKETWVYQFPMNEGPYTIRAKATDIMGNEGAPSAEKTIIADATPPQVTIDALANPVKPTLNSNSNWQISLSGTAIDPPIGALSGSGVYPESVQVLLTGADGAVVSDRWQTATYDETSKAWTVDYVFPAARVDVTGVYTVSVRAEDSAGSNGGNSTGNAGATAIVQLDHTGPSAALSPADATRQLITETITISGPVANPLGGIQLVEASFTPVEQIAALPNDVSAEQAQSLLDAAAPNRWLPATLVQQGAGITSTTWSLLTPATLEGEYQLDLRGTDLSGNVLVSSNAWRGIIDMLAPRVSITKTNTGITYTQRPFVHPEQIQYECVAEDRYLHEPDFVCSASGGAEPTRTFNTDPLLQTLFPDRTILERVESTYFRWETVPQAESIEACDIFGRCATASTDSAVVAAQTRVMAAAAAVAEPRALVVSPVQDRYVAVDGDLPVTIAAESSTALQEVTVELDGAVVATLTFDQSENITRTQRTVQISNVAEGAHTLVAKATDWAGAVQQALDPVAFTLDAAPPTATIGTNLLRLADTWALGSDMLRFNGTANDSVGLAAVQLKIGDAPFVEAGFDENSGTWRTAQLVPDPQGKSLAVTVRAIDRAGRITDVSGTIGVDLTPTEVTITPPDTTITPTVVSGNVNSVSVSFAGVAGTNEVGSFECRLDGGPFQPCVSPQQYSGLNNGVNLFEVRAIDDQGFVDPTPASEEWTISVTTLQTTITESPSDPTNSRDANFAFSGAPTFECSLDGSAFTPCSSPQSYAGLRDGEHTFRVRGLDGDNTGAATRFTWTVVNAAPIAVSQAVTITQNSIITLTLAATDEDPLTYKVGSPTHGVLNGVPPALTYSPDTNYFGSDSFTFVANDGLVDSNIATVDITIQVLDGNAPTSTITLTPDVPTGLNGWYTSTVTATVSSDDGPNGSGVAETRCVLDPASPPLVFGDLEPNCAYVGIGADVTTDGPHTIYAASRDALNNSELPVSKGFQIDLTAPTISARGVPTSNGAGWNNSDVTVQFTCADGMSGVASCAAEQTVTTEAANQSITGVAIDNAGNNASATLAVSLDKTRPTASAAIAPVPNAAGWNNVDVTVTFTGTDALSGITGCTTPILLSDEGADQSASGTCTDVADNVSDPATAENINIDKSAPIATASALPTPNAAGWNNVDVTVTFTGTDALSGIASCTTPVVLSGDGLGQEAIGTCIDVADNVSAPAQVANINIDQTPPTVACSASPDRLWPPNNKLNDINVTVNVEDALSGAAGFVLVSVTNDETNDPNDMPGWEIGTPDTSGQLKASRAGNGDGRVYTLTYEGMDVAGNTARCSTIVFVPHDNNQPNPPPPTSTPEPEAILANDRLELTGQSTSYSGTPATNAPAGVFTINVTFQHSSQVTLRDIYYEVNTLTGGNLLLNADGGADGIGSTLTLGTPTEVAPNETFSIEFQIGLATTEPFTFVVDTFAIIDGDGTATIDAGKGSSGFRFQIEGSELTASPGNTIYLPVVSQ